jgi:hypothetical protein
MTLQPPKRAHDKLVRGTPGLVSAAGVVKARRSVNADADVEAVLREEGAPLVVEQHAVGLEVVDARPARRQVALLKLDTLR